MALNFSVSDPYSGRPAFYAYLSVEGTQDKPNNRTTFHVRLWARNPDRSRLTYYLNNASWSVGVAGKSWKGSHSLDFRGGQYSILLLDTWTGWISHNSSGNLNIGYGFTHGPAGIFGTASNSVGSVAVTRIPKRPNPPAPLSGIPDQITTTSMRYRFNTGNNNGASITKNEVQASKASSFSSPITKSLGGSTKTVTFTGLTPGTRYYFRSRSYNSMGWSPWTSKIVNAVTLPAGPPTLTVTPDVDGKSAAVKLAPPGNSGSVSSYSVYYRTVGSTGNGTLKTFSGTTGTVTGLTPGQAYEWRAAAKIGTYTSPYTAWTTVVQPDPNTEPGNYFDGDSTGTGDITYSWDGTRHLSKSLAKGAKPVGWGDPFDGQSQIAFYRATGGYPDTTSGYVKAIVTAAQGLEDIGIGVLADYIEVAEGGIYTGSMYARVYKDNVRLQLGVYWADEGGLPLGSEVLGELTGDPVPKNTWTRIVINNVEAPPGAVKAMLFLTGLVTGGTMVPGDVIDVDAAMFTLGQLYPYFDGSTKDTGQYVYAWEDTPDRSISSRTTLADVYIDPLADPDCPPTPSAPRPPAISDPCIEEVGSWRRYWAVIAASEVSEWLDVVPTITITSYDEPAGQVRIRVFENPNDELPEAYSGNDWVGEQIVRYIPADTTLVIDGVGERVTARVGDDGDWLSADHLLYGTGGVPPEWPVLSCGIGYLMSFDVPLDAPLNAISIGVQLTRRQ